MPDVRGSGLRLPWFIYDLYNHQLIVSPNTIPGDITDKKGLVLAETPIPGLDFDPVNPSGAGNRKISLNIPIINRLTVIGNVLLIKQFDRLRHKGGSFIFNKTYDKFTPRPKVLYSWGTGSVPLEFFVDDVTFVHKGDGWINSFGNPQFTVVNIQLTLDQQSDLYKAEEIWRELAGYAGQAQSVFNTVREFKGERSL